MKKLALGIEYNGANYCGWQKQKNILSVQECVESALHKITSERIKIYCAGRTDAGVHAVGQVVHFETNMQYSDSVWTFGVNRYLPPSVCIRWVSIVNKEFHARLSAISRRYYYIIYNNMIRSVMLLGRTWHYKKFLDVCRMFTAGQYLLGENDFSAFRSSGCQSYSARREVYHLNVIRKDRCIVIDIKANAFLYHMVRNIVGSLVEIGCGKKPVTWMLQLLKNNDRSLVGTTAPAHGLYLVEVEYPAHFSIPSILYKDFRNTLCDI